MKPFEGKGAGCLILFILPFAGVGTFMLYMIISDVIGWVKMRTWKEVPARILSANLDTSHSSDSTTYSAEAEYEYEYEGRRYKSNRVSRYTGSDNIGKFHQDTFRELSTHLSANKPFRCFVNPRAPNESILYRNVRLGMIQFYGLFAVTFGGIGYGVLLGSIVALFGGQKSTSLEKMYPGQPWLHRPDWSRGEARSSMGYKMLISIALAVFVGLIFLPLLIFLPEEILNGNYSALVFLISPAIASLIIAWAVRNVLQWKRFGSSVLVLSKNPVRPGESLRGFIKTGAMLPDSAKISLELFCNKSVTMRSGGKTRTTTETIWEHSATTFGTTGADGKTAIQLDLPIPENNPASGQVSENTQIEYKLKVKANIPGVDMNLKFKVPVFKL